MKRLILFFLTALISFSCSAKLRLPNILSDNMVLQASSDARLWGWADAGKTVTVKCSWMSTVKSTVAGKDGRWSATVAMPSASYTPLSLTFESGDEKVTVKNILAGEVWVCAGQSNMEMPVEGFDNCPVEGYNDVVLDAKNHSAIRFVKIPSIMRQTPQEDADCKWEVTSSETVRRASATGWFFAHTINTALDIPVGLIMANKGGSRVESWLTKENLQRCCPAETLDSIENVKKFRWDFLYPLYWGNGTFNPIINYTVSGIIFYQGCSNVGDAGNKYSDNLATLVNQWREQFRQPNLPFYFVQIAPYWNDDLNGTAGALLREQQKRAQTIIPNSALICTNDLVYSYETKQIHPTMKRQVGERLAYNALVKKYGQTGFLCESPEVDSYTFSGDTCIVTLKNDYNAISRFEGIQGFELAGEDRQFYKAVAYHDYTKGIVITSTQVKKPVAVRYCFRNFLIGNVANRAMLPLFPFRSDKF
ncbi:MAG: 9-O-acetylesterase [Bacteroidaceae bacterium]|nr:9-O-acetylesterase [Bacteroidaceae bacterium]